MFRRSLIAALAATAGAITVPAPLWAQLAPSLVAPTTTTTTAPQLVIVIPPSTTTPLIVAPTTSTTSTTTQPAVIVTPTTTSSTTTTAPPVFGDPTTTTTPVIVAQTTTPTVATTAPALATPTTAPDEDPADVPIGGLDPAGVVPDGLDLSAFPDAPPSPTAGGGDGPTFSAGMTCFNQCIKSGVAYPRGFGALLVVETYVPARLWLGVSDANNDYVGHTTSPGMVTEFSWALDHLDPGETYYVIVAATDENDDTAHAYGSFETLSERSVTIWVGDPAVAGGPTNIVDTDVYLKAADLDYHGPFDTPEELVYYSLPRHLDLAVHVFRTWATSQYTYCEGVHSITPYGDSDEFCGTWNTATLTDIDTDAIPAGRSHWTEVEFSLSFDTGDGVPPADAGARYFDFSVWVEITVEYS